MRWLSCLIEKNKLPAELLIVDYNPVPENEPLIKMLDWPKNRKYLTIRLLHVPNETHKRLINPEVRKTVPLFEFPAKNMAIRRAKGEYILSANADIVFHPSIIRLIAKKNLSNKSYYRTDRFDYKKIDFYDFNNPDATLHKIQRNVFRLFLRVLDYHVTGGENFFEKNLSKLRQSFQVLLQHSLLKAEPLARIFKMKVIHECFIFKYHINASGDFMLMHRNHWFTLRGYPEDAYISTHCDAIFTVMAAACGLRQIVLPWPVYHQDHERRYNIDMHRREINNKDISDMHRRLVDDTRQMESSHCPKIINDRDWGNASENFAETVL